MTDRRALKFETAMGRRHARREPPGEEMPHSGRKIWYTVGDCAIGGPGDDGDLGCMTKGAVETYSPTREGLAARSKEEQAMERRFSLARMEALRSALAEAVQRDPTFSSPNVRRLARALDQHVIDYYYLSAEAEEEASPCAGPSDPSPNPCGTII